MLNVYPSGHAPLLKLSYLLLLHNHGHLIDRLNRYDIGISTHRRHLQASNEDNMTCRERAVMTLLVTSVLSSYIQSLLVT